jgi:hypothetical protein
MFNQITTFMKRLTLALAAVLAFAVFTFGQEDYTMYKVMYLEPDFENLKDLGEAMADHNKTFHNEAPSRGHIWIVHTGPHSGQWLYVLGSATYTQMDEVNLGDDHMDHWVGKVLPNVEKMSDGGLWRKNDEHSYEGTIGFTGKEVLTFFKIRDFAEYRFKDMVENIKEVYEAKAYPNFFELYYSQFSRKCGYDVMIASGFENWAFFDNKPNFKADYEEIHGEGSFQQLLEEYRDIVEGEYDELIMYVPELSADPVEEE